MAKKGKRKASAGDVATNRQAYYAAAPGDGRGHLVFLRDTTLMAQAFDPVRLTFGGEPAPILATQGIDRERGSRRPSDQRQAAGRHARALDPVRHRAAPNGDYPGNPAAVIGGAFLASYRRAPSAVLRAGQPGG